MKRHMELIRKIMLEIEKAEGDPAMFQEIPGYEERVIGHHQFLLLDAGLIRGHVFDPADDIVMAQAICLSWKGHEFLDAARDDEIWNKAMQTAKDAGSSLTFAVLGQLLVQYLKDKIGMTN